MKKKEEIYYTGSKLSYMLGTAFIILKLCHVIDWAWIWVLAPFWAPFALIIIIALIVWMIIFIN